MHQHHYMDNIVWATFFVCACMCFLLSTCYHMFKLHSEAVYNVVCMANIQTGCLSNA